MERSKQIQSIAYNKDDEPLSLSKHVFDIFLKQENPSDLMSLYCFYYYTAKWQGTNKPRATTEYTATGMNWTTNKVRRVKNQLKELGLVEDIIDRSDTNKIIGHFIQINLVWKNPTLPCTPQCGFDHTVEFIQGNALNPNNKISSSVPSDADPLGMVVSSMFDKFWSIYPRKVGKGKALTKWNSLCKKGRDRPTWATIKRAILNQIKSEQWQDPKFIPHPATWLNQFRWLDDPKEMKSYSTEAESCPLGWKFGVDYNPAVQGCMNCEDNTPKIYDRCRLLYKSLL